MFDIVMIGVIDDCFDLIHKVIECHGFLNVISQWLPMSVTVGS
jgi:hypothetical protein